MGPSSFIMIVKIFMYNETTNSYYNHYLTIMELPITRNCVRVYIRVYMNKKIFTKQVQVKSQKPLNEKVQTEKR